MNIDELKAVAKTATPGPWTEEGTGPYGTVCAPKSGWITRDIIRMDGSTMAAFHQEGNRKFIAAANPDMILRMISVMEQMAEALEYPYDTVVINSETVSTKAKEALRAWNKLKVTDNVTT